jgi:amino acid transporter
VSQATAHITEEIKNPELKAPWAISMAMLFTYVVGWLFTIVLCFCMGSPAEIIASPIAQPVAQIFYNVLGKSGGITFTVCAFVIIKFVCFTAMQALGRTVFAFSRDRLIPFSNVWTTILPLTGTPILAVWICVFFCIAINLIGLGSYIAILGVFNVTAIALDWSYCEYTPVTQRLMQLTKVVNRHSNLLQAHFRQVRAWSMALGESRLLGQFLGLYLDPLRQRE